MSNLDILAAVLGSAIAIWIALWFLVCRVRGKMNAPYCDDRQTNHYYGSQLGEECGSSENSSGSSSEQ